MSRLSRKLREREFVELTRELLEPKLIGKRIGIAPVFMLLAVYAGVKLFGVGGIVKGPLALIVIYEIWKTELPA